MGERVGDKGSDGSALREPQGWVMVFMVVDSRPHTALMSALSDHLLFAFHNLAGVGLEGGMGRGFFSAVPAL